MDLGITELRNKYLRHDKKFPHVWCPGCGIGIVMGALIRGVERTGLEKDEIVLASGIGCSGRMPAEDSRSSGAILTWSQRRCTSPSLISSLCKAAVI